MKIDQLMDAIEEIDDRYIEESAYGVKRKRNIPWGMIITAACFCLVIGAAMFMQSLGILPHLNGTEGTTQPTTPSTTDSSEPTVPQPTVVLPPPERLFTEKESVHNEALYWIFGGEGNVQYYYLLGHGALGRDTELTEQEKKLLDSKLHYGIDHSEVWRLTPEQIENAFWSVYGLTWEQVMANFDAGSYSTTTWMYNAPVYLEETGCYYGYYYDKDHEGIEIADVETEYFDDGTIHMYYTAVSLNEQRVAELRPYATGYHLLSNKLVVRYEEPTNPSDPVDARSSVEEFFSDKENWQNLLILPAFADPTQFDLRPIYLRAMDGESTYATDLEHEKLASVIPGYSRDKLFRATKAQLDELMLAIFNITTDQLASDWEDNFTYLEETGCYYARLNNSRGYTVYIDRTEDCSDGTVLMYYALARGEDPYLVARLQPHDTGYYILSNERYVDNTGKSEDQIAMEELFKGSSWFNQALTCEYDSPEQIGILSFFYCGIPGESKITDEEKAQLKNMQGFGTPAGDICRLHPDKMNAVLTECFGITLEDVDPTGFNSLAYLESTNCYYFKASSPNFVENFKADRVERNSDRTIDVYYNISYKGDYVVTVKPHGDSYRILSNRCINSTPLIPPTPTEPTGDTELEKLFAGYRELPEKELSQKMVDAFLADPDTFVQLLAKQDRYYGILLGVLSRNVTDNHPQIAAYRAAVGSLLAKELPEKETLIVKGMAVYSGISNYFPDEPTADDYVKLLDIIQHYSHEGECNELLRRYCIADPRGVLEQIVLTEIGSYSFYTERLTFLAPQEELKQLKQAMTQLISELKTSSDSRAQDQIKCAQQIIESCDKEIE